jgi:hypothetical protein
MVKIWDQALKGGESRPFAPIIPARFIFFTTPLLHYSITPILRIQLTSAFDKKADYCSLPKAVIYTLKEVILCLL